MVSLEEIRLDKRTQHVTNNSTFIAYQENNNHVTSAAPHMCTSRSNNNNSGGRSSHGVPVTTIVVEGTEVEVADHTISNTRRGINPHNSHEHIDLGHILHGSLLHVHTLQLEIGSTQPLSTVKQAFLGRDHNKHISLQHNHHTHQQIFRLQCTLCL
jgi:hypothetical protein